MRADARVVKCARRPLPVTAVQVTEGLKKAVAAAEEGDWLIAFDGDQFQEIADTAHVVPQSVFGALYTTGKGGGESQS